MKRQVFALLFAAAGSAFAADAPKVSTAYFAGGCFWCMEADFEKLPGVIEAISGYTGGTTKNPTYEESSSGTTGHAESVEVRYDASKVTYAQLLDWYWHHVDPTVKDQQFCDEGNQYRTAIFVKSAQERQLAEASLAEVKRKLGAPVYTQIVDAAPFYVAEDYHQDYYKKNPLRYKLYRLNCGRDARLEQVWGKH